MKIKLDFYYKYRKYIHRSYRWSLIKIITRWDSVYKYSGTVAKRLFYFFKFIRRRMNFTNTVNRKKTTTFYNHL